MCDSQKPDANRRPQWEWGKDLENCLGAARETTDPSQLEKMAEDILSGQVLDDGVIAEEIVLNKRTQFQAAARLSEIFENDFAYELCSRDDATPEVLDKFCLHWDLLIANKIANHHNTLLSTLKKMVASKEPYLGPVAIETGRFSESDLEAFGTNAIVSVRAAVARMTESAQLLSQLAQDSHQFVRLKVVENAFTAIDVVEALALKHDSREAQIAAAKRTAKADVLWRLANSLSESKNAELAKAIMQNPNFQNADQFSPQDQEKWNAAQVLAALYA